MRTFFETFRRLKLAQKIATATFVLGIAVTAVSGCLQYLVFSYERNAQVQAHFDEAVLFSRKHIQAALNTGNENKLNEILSTILDINSVSRVELSIPQGNANSSSLVHEIDSPTLGLFSPYSAEYEFQNMHGPAVLIIHSQHQDIFDHSGKAFLLALLTIIAAVLAIAAGNLFFVRHLIFRHIEKISAFARHLSVDNLGETLQLDRAHKNKDPDELDLLVNAIEHMRDQLIKDLDERRAIEFALIAEKQERIESRKKIEDAKASDHAKSQFIATMSHEIRTPMNGVIGMVEMLRSTELNKDQSHYLDVISRSGESLMSIINDILDYSKIEAGKLSLEQIDFSIRELIDDCMQLFSGTAHSRKLELVGNISSDVPDTLRGDPTRLRQILVNLIGNAFKFTKEGDIFIDVSLISSPNDRVATLHFSVQDSGIGIDQPVQQSIFDAFKQADNTTTRKFGGTGLGLAICKQLVELMGGRIGLTSEVDVGSKFWFTARLDRTEIEGGAAKSCSLALSNKSLLYIHPTDFIDAALTSHAEALNLSVTCCHDEAGIVRILQDETQSFDFVILSQHMWHVSGLLLAKKIRQLNAYRHTPILMLTTEQTSSFTLEEMGPIASLLKLPLFVDQIISALLSEATGISLNQLMPANLESSPKKVQLNVIVAEDNVVNRMVIEGLLSKINIKPEFAENGVQAVEKYCRPDNKCDLILMDCEMPEMDGFEATLKIRRWESNRGQAHVPIIALTAHVEAEHRQRVIDVGMNYYVSKPVNLEKITDALSAIGLA